MNFKTTYVLFAILALFIVVFAVALWYDPSARADKTAYILPALHNPADPIQPEDIDRVEIQRAEPKETLVLQRDSDSQRWNIVEPKKLPADRTAVSQLVRQLFDASRDEKADRPPNLAAWGLEPPQEVVTLKKGDRAFKLNVGATSELGSDSVIYALDPTRPKEPMAVKKARLDGVLKKLDDFRDTELLAANPSEITAFALGKAGDKDAVALDKDAAGRWLYATPAGYGEAESGFEEPAPTPPNAAPKPPASVSAVLNNLAALRVEKTDKGSDFVADDVPAADLEKYNLDPAKAAVLRIEVRREEPAGKNDAGKKKSRKVVLLVGNSKKADDKTDKYYAKLEDESTVVKVAAKDVDPLGRLLADPGALRDRYLVRMTNPPSALDVKNGYGTLELRRTKPFRIPDLDARLGAPPDRWTLWRGDTYSTVDPEIMQSPASLVNVLRQKNLIDSFIDLKSGKEEREKQEKELEVDRPAVVVSLWSEEDGVVKDDAADKGEAGKRTKPQLKEKEPTVRLTFGKVVNERDKELVVVKREVRERTAGSGYAVTLVKVPRLALDKAKDGPLAYMDKRLEPFNTGLRPAANVTKVVVRNGGSTIEVTRDKDADPWKIVKPTEMAGRTADEAKLNNLLATLNGMQAVRLVADKPKEEELDRDYGLKNPSRRVEITVTKDNKPTTYTYDFGKEATDGTVYAKQSQRDLVFTVDKATLAALPADVLDPVVFHFDPLKARGLKITGWQDLLGSPITLDLESKDGSVWKVKAGPSGFQVDPLKVNQLLEQLKQCRAERFVSFKSTKGDYGFELPKGGMVLEIAVEGEAKPIQLTVGKADGDKGYFATSNRAEGDVFVLPKAVFDGPKSMPTYFKQ